MVEFIKEVGFFFLVRFRSLKIMFIVFVVIDMNDVRIWGDLMFGFKKLIEFVIYFFWSIKMNCVIENYRNFIKGI